MDRLCGFGPGRVVLGPLSAATKGRGLFGGFLLGSFLLGLLVATLQMETSSKPFSFCLPGHREAVRRLVLLVGLVVSLVFLLVCVALLASPSFTGPLARSIMPPEWLILVLGSHFCASVTAYLLGAGVAFSAYVVQSALSFMVLVVSMCVLFDGFTTIQYPILHWPVAVMALALVVGLASWWWLGRPAWFRRSCVTPWIGFFDPWDRSQIQKYRALYAARFTKNIPPELDRFFQRAIGTRRPSSPAKYAWGVLYTTCVLVGPQWKWLLTFAVLAITCTAYFPPMAPGVISVVFFMMTGFVQPPLCTAWLVAGGRKERFFATVALILVLGVVSALLVGVLAGLTHLLAPLAPPIRWKGLALDPHALSFQVLAIPSGAAPRGGSAADPVLPQAGCAGSLDHAGAHRHHDVFHAAGLVPGGHAGPGHRRHRPVLGRLHVDPVPDRHAQRFGEASENLRQEMKIA